MSSSTIVTNEDPSSFLTHPPTKSGMGKHETHFITLIWICLNLIIDELEK